MFGLWAPSTRFERLSVLPNGLIAYRTKYALRGGRTHRINPYLESFQPSPRGSVIVHPTELSAARQRSWRRFRASRWSFCGTDPFLGRDEKVQRQEIFQLEAGYFNQESELFERDLAAYGSRGSIRWFVRQSANLQRTQDFSPFGCEPPALDHGF